MKLVSRQNIIVKSVYIVGLLFLAHLVPVKSALYDVLCPDSENPFNILFAAPKEILVDDKIVEVGPMAIDFLDPKDVGCKANFDDVKKETFIRAVNCNLKGPQLVICQVDKKCTNQRREVISKLRIATMKLLDDVVLKTKAIKFFNNYRGVKRLVFGTQPLSELSGLLIVKRATSGRFNMLKGFSVTKGFPTPTRDMFNSIFSEGVDLYAQLAAAEEPTGLLAERNMCIRTTKMTTMPPNELHFCYDIFFNGLKDNTKLDVPDRKLVDLINKALKYSVYYLSEGTQQFSEVKIPFIGHCIRSDGFQPSESYKTLLNTVQTLKLL